MSAAPASEPALREAGQAVDAAAFRKAMANYPTGVAIVTGAGADGQPLGMVIGSFTSVSLEPMLVGFLPTHTSWTWAQIAKSGRFRVNVLSCEQAGLSQQFATAGESKFDGLAWTVSDFGNPVIAGSVLGIECAVHDQLEAGDHLFVLGRVLECAADSGPSPLLFHRGAYAAVEALSPVG